MDSGRGHWHVGGGVTGRVNARVDFQVAYDWYTRSGFDNHTVLAGVGVGF